MPDTPQKICAVCQRVLDIRMDAYGVRYQHTLLDQAAHAPVPVPVPDDWTGGRCDFCSQFGVRYELPVRDFRVPGFPNETSAGGWAACERCAEMIRHNDWPALADQALARLHELSEVTGSTDEQYIRLLYRMLRTNITGPLRRIGRAQYYRGPRAGQDRGH